MRVFSPFSVRDSPFFAQLALDVENARIAFSDFSRDCDASRLFFFSPAVAAVAPVARPH